jgi:hypothetical protein
VPQPHTIKTMRRCAAQIQRPAVPQPHAVKTIAPLRGSDSTTSRTPTHTAPLRGSRSRISWPGVSHQPRRGEIVLAPSVRAYALT